MTHIWLLSAGEPSEERGLHDFLRRRLSDPHVLRVPGWLSAIAIWFYTWLHHRRLAETWRQLPGPSPTTSDLAEQVSLLQRTLGKKYQCRAVLRYQSPDADEVGAGIGRGERVLLLPLLPHRGPALYSAISAATAVLRKRGAEISTIPSYPEHRGYVTALAETLRAALADLARETADHQTRYEVLFTAPLPPGHKGIPDEMRAELELTVAAVIAEVGLVRPHHLGFTAALIRMSHAVPSTAEQLAAVGRGNAAVVVPLALPFEGSSTLVELDQALAGVAQEAGVWFIRAATVSARPTFTRALTDLIHRAEHEAGWRGKED